MARFEKMSRENREVGEEKQAMNLFLRPLRILRATQIREVASG